jgi:hypothetical protein
MSSISCGGAADYVVLQEKNVALKVHTHALLLHLRSCESVHQY